MFCKNCGANIEPGSTFCNNCGSKVENDVTYQTIGPIQNNGTKSPINVTSYFVWSIVETFCVNLITGIIGIILYCTSLKPAADKGDIEAVKKAKTGMKIDLWIGFGLWVLSIIMLIIYFFFVLSVINL